jgi:putative ABC transport system ATP-binding protein
MPLIEAKNVTKVFDREGTPTHALRGVSFCIERGEFIAIVGPSGSGKSTILQILGLLDGLTEGTYLLNGVDTGTIPDDELAGLRNKTIGFIFQSFNLLARTSVLENVKLPLIYSDIADNKWDELAKGQINAVGLEHRIDFETNRLSGGERQRVAIARSLVNDPDIIFADEPTGNLDSTSGKAIMDLLEQLHQHGHTVILITHDRSLAKRADRALLVQDGLITWDGSASNIPEY